MKNKFLLGIALCVIANFAGIASAQDKTATFNVDSKPVLLLKVPTAAKVETTHEGYLKILSTNLSLYIWSVPDANTVSAAVPRAAEIIKSEFIKFKPSATTDIQIAGAPAKDLKGPGNEADDEDAGNAEVILFTAGARVFAACVHGEFDNASHEHAHLLAVLETAQAPH